MPEGSFNKVVKIQRQVIHFIGSTTTSGDHPWNLQSYFYNEGATNENDKIDTPAKEAIQSRLMELIKSVNPYFGKIRQLTNVQLENNVSHLKLLKHRGRTNKPAVSEVAVLLLYPGQNTKPRDIIIDYIDGPIRRIHDLSSPYDPLCYPLTHMHGGSGIASFEELRTIEALSFLHSKLHVSKKLFKRLQISCPTLPWPFRYYNHQRGSN